jgi:hypothetical protein
MVTNLLSDRWTGLDLTELRALLNERIGGPGQYDGLAENPDVLYLPLARGSCRIKLTFRDKKIVAIEPGPAFDPGQWHSISEEIENSILAGPMKVGRDFSFSSFRVLGSWRGRRSGVHILPPPNDAPRAPYEMAEHPFILEFPMRTTNAWAITNHRRIREHRRLTLLLNVLLAGRTSLQPRRPEHFWARVSDDFKIQWVQQFFIANLGSVIVEEPSPPAPEQLEEVDAEAYYERIGHDGKGLRVPADLDESICRYIELSAGNRQKFDRATYWVDMASRQWNISMSLSFAALVAAVESLTDRGTTHRVYCDKCQKECPHDAPGATAKFREFFESYAPDQSLANRRSKMYALRSGILHGGELMQLDQDYAFGAAWDPPQLIERDLHEELWSLTRIALRNWLKNPPAV